MRKLFLIYNPASGQRTRKRAEQVALVTEVFRQAGMQVEACATTHRGSAVQQTRLAVEAGCDLVVACGGDGTFNECLNGMMQASRKAELGVVPLGSGNLLATDLHLPSNPVRAAHALLSYKARDVQPGTITCQTLHGPETRHFIIAAGVGSDAELMYRTAAEIKERFGRNAYFIEMARMTFKGEFPLFHVEWKDEQGAPHSDNVALVMAIRARKFPGLLRFVNLRSSLLKPEYALLLFRTDKVRHFLNYFASVASGLNWRVPQIDVVHASWFRCAANSEPRIRCQADGELLGSVPAEVGIAGKTFRLLMPE
ncbi:MAG TPA: YegS/Rv2252/BmrU family lipid kinase [Candidatus Angelobacter sp.]|nr:YegS/Rv2252/BmrU family lipid kinase [Candidatus Angelobacter sp.]